MSNTIGGLIILCFWITFGLLFILVKNTNKYELKSKYNDICNELNMNHFYSKILKDKCLFELCNEDNTNTFKDKIIQNYAYLIINELHLTDINGYLKKNNEKHKQDIILLQKILKDRFYEYNKFLYEKSIGLIQVIQTPLTQLKYLETLDIPNKQKNKEALEIIIEIYNLYDSFFEIVSILNEDYESKINKEINKEKKPISEEINKDDQNKKQEIEYATNDTYVLSDLNNYKELLDNVKYDMENRRGIF